MRVQTPLLVARPGYQHKVAVLTMAERGGKQRSIKLTRSPSAFEIKWHLGDHVHPESRLVTDGAQYYKGALIRHESVDHSAEEWVRGDGAQARHGRRLSERQKRSTFIAISRSSTSARTTASQM